MAGSDQGCAAHDAVKVRPKLRLSASSWSPRSRLTEFTLEPVKNALDRVEFDGVDPVVASEELTHPDAQTHPGLVRYARHALTAYLLAVAAQDSLLEPVRDQWVVQREGIGLWELYAWGRRYASPDGGLREFRFLKFGSARSRQRDEAQTAIAAFAAAFGNPAPDPRPWSEAFRTKPSDPPREIRVAEVNLVLGSYEELFRGSPDDARRYFDAHGRDEVARLARGGAAKPGSDCGDCKLVASCDAVPIVPGLLGLPALQVPRRTMSASNLRYYRSCPAQAHLRSLHLPAKSEYDEASTLGQAVHAWLDLRHREGGPCRAEDAPTGEWAAGPWAVTGDHARRGIEMISRHRETCPFQHVPTITDVRIEPLLAVYDPTAEIVVMAKPDMLYVDDDVLVWRELKTTAKERRFDSAKDPLDRNPQLALAVLLLASGALRPAGSDSRVELEVLRADGADLQLIDSTDAERIAKAREIIREYALPWRRDETFAARPGENCRWCPVSRWCPSFPAHLRSTATE